MVEISAQVVKELRDKTSAGMMECKKALQESNGNIEKATEILRQKGLLLASKKANRLTSEGLINCYIHAGNKLGVLVEVNCETDFVARLPEFHELTHNIAIQIAACPYIKFISIESIPYSVIETEKEIERSKDDLKNRAIEMREQIVNERVQKRLQELTLMNQTFICDSTITLGEAIKQNISKLGENIQIRRFERFILGEPI